VRQLVVVDLPLVVWDPSTTDQVIEGLHSTVPPLGNEGFNLDEVSTTLSRLLLVRPSRANVKLDAVGGAPLTARGRVDVRSTEQS
jgi:hypothetical protein